MTEDGIFNALADPTRRRILELLRSGAKSSGELAKEFDSAWPTISRHLAVLRDAGLVTTERSGSTVLYELNTTVFQETIQHLMKWVRPGGKNGKRKA